MSRRAVAHLFYGVLIPSEGEPLPARARLEANGSAEFRYLHSEEEGQCHWAVAVPGLYCRAVEFTPSERTPLGTADAPLPVPTPAQRTAFRAALVGLGVRDRPRWVLTVTNA